MASVIDTHLTPTRSILQNLARMLSLPAMTFSSRLVAELPADPSTDNLPRAVPGASYSRVMPTPVLAPQLLAWSEELAEMLGVARPDSATPEGRAAIAILAGNALAPGMQPHATRYGGHQFGHWAGQLGDGRAIGLGEHRGRDGQWYEWQLKGAGPTPYSRFADGRAVLRSSLREFICSEAMHALGVPTTRALSLVSSGESVVRDLFYDGRPAPEPGAIVCRVAPSFLRFGHFEIHAASEEPELLRRLIDHAIRHHFPDIDPASPDAIVRWFEEICVRTAVMIAHWMRVGFIHGVMNTDNMSILGLTIDYGPYGWLETYEPDFTPNTTDANGRRYAYAKQPQVALWNLARLASALLTVVEAREDLEAGLERYREVYQREYRTMLADKLGLRTLGEAGDEAMVEEMFALLGAVDTDTPIFFRELSRSEGFSAVRAAVYAEQSLDAALTARWEAWLRHLQGRINAERLEPEERRARMERVNPCYLPRNYLVQQVIESASAADLAPLHALLRVLHEPYREQPGAEAFAARRPEWARHAPGCGALSCSS